VIDLVRDNIIKEVQKRLYEIKTTNGFDFDVALVTRNPEEEPSPEQMPMCQVFEFPEVTLQNSTRGGKPIYTKELQIVVESWYNSDSQGSSTPDILKFLKYKRKQLFKDGVSLGGLASEMIEMEVSRVMRPPIGNNIVGIGQVLQIKFIEDFNTF
jgi:hypothetical protein